MKPTPKPRAVRPMKPICMYMDPEAGICYPVSDAFVNDRPVLVIDLSPESVEALMQKAAQNIADSYWKKKGACVAEIDMDRAKAASPPSASNPPAWRKGRKQNE